MHGVAFGRARLVNDALKQTANSGVGQRPGIVAFRVGQHFDFTLRLIQRDVCLLLELADFERAARALVEKLNELLVDFVDAAAPIGEIHGATFPKKLPGPSARRERPWRAACFKTRTFSDRADAAASMALADAPDLVAFSISETSAEPTTAASARPPRTETSPGSEMPKPTATGRCVTPRARRKSAGRSSGKASFAPVTPVREIRYRKPEEQAAIFASRSSVEVGAPRKIVSRR